VTHARHDGKPRCAEEIPASHFLPFPVFSSFAQPAMPCEARATETGTKEAGQAWRGTVKGWR
jgi:hypothetical protein